MPRHAQLRRAPRPAHASDRSATTGPARRDRSRRHQDRGDRRRRADQQVLGSARHPTPTTGGPDDVAEEMAKALTSAAEAAGVEADGAEGRRRRVAGRRSTTATGTVAGARNLPGWDGAFELGGDAGQGARDRGVRRQRRPGRDAGRVQARRRQAVQVAARRLLGNRRRRRHRPRRQALARPWRGRGDRPHGDRERRPQVPVRPPRLHGGLCRAGVDGGPRAARAGEGTQDRPLQADEGARPRRG